MSAITAMMEAVPWMPFPFPGLAGRGASAEATPSRQEEAKQPKARFAPEEDAAWIARIQSGDQDAARALVERLYPTVLKMVRSHLPRRTSEEDIVQAVFGKIFKKLDQFSCQVPLEHWVSRIAINTCMHILRHELARPEMRMGDLTEDEEAVVSNLASTAEELPGNQSSAAREIVEKLLVRLKPDERLVITLLHLDEKGVAEISHLTGWSVSRVKVKAFRARQKMRRLWDTLLKGERF